MTEPDTPLASGKGHRDENFPVASVLLKRVHRAPIMAFYRFARAADDIADHPTASADDKRPRLATMRAGLTGVAQIDGCAPEAMALARVQATLRLDPTQASDLLRAFEQDVEVSRYRTWEDLIDYCRLSAMPVGRFVLDVHGEDRAIWPLSDALCAALQVINHLQDCGKDYRAIDRVYLPGDMIAAHGGRIEDLGGALSTPGLLAAIREAAARTRDLLAISRPFASAIRDRRLALEVAIIQRLAEKLTDKLLRHDPLSERVHHRTASAAWIAMGAVATQLVRGGS